MASDDKNNDFEFTKVSAEEMMKPLNDFHKKYHSKDSIELDSQSQTCDVDGQRRKDIKSKQQYQNRNRGE